MTDVIKPGETLPDMSVKAIVKDEIKDIKLSILFADHSLMHPKDKKIVLFSVPGAFTPTCSAKHLPGFKNLYQDIIDKGVEKIMCFAVNDPHVMKAWAEQNDVFGKIEMISDPDASYTKEIGLDFYTPHMGIRSVRFAMIIDNKVITHLFVEEPGVFDVSSAENIIKHL